MCLVEGAWLGVGVAKGKWAWLEWAGLEACSGRGLKGGTGRGLKGSSGVKGKGRGLKCLWAGLWIVGVALRRVGRAKEGRGVA